MTPDEPINPPAPHPCGSCPYRCDVPSGVWDEEEYQADGRVCAGWAGCHDMEENLAVRLSVATGRMDDETYETLLNYETPTPLWDSGGEAASHGVENLFDPDEDAQRVMDKLRSKRERT